MIIKIYKSILFNIIFKEFRKFTYSGWGWGWGWG